MNHLSDDQLSARLDGALNASDDAAAGRHLDDCSECRARLAALSELDASLRGALAHDPGDEYFASFADRLGEKIAASSPASSPAAAPASGGLFGWWRSPRALALVGSTAAVLAVAAVALKLSSDRGVEGFAENVAPRTEVGAPLAVESAPAPAAEALAEEAPAAKADAPMAAPEPESRAGQAAPARRTPAARAQEVRTLAGGEQVAVPRRDLPAVTQRATPAAPAPTSAETRVRKPQAATPLNAAPANPAPEPVETAKGAAADVAAPVAPPAAKDRVTASKPFAVAPPSAPPAQAPTPTSEPERKSRFDVRNQLEKSKAIAPAPAAGSSTQSLAPPAAGGSAPFTAPSAAAPGSKPAARGELTSRFRATPYEAALEAATQAERAAQRERSAPAWDRAAAAWAQAASVAADESPVRSARRSAADSRMTAWRIEPTDARRAAALSAVDACIAVMPAGRQQEEARRWKAELER